MLVILYNFLANLSRKNITFFLIFKIVKYYILSIFCIWKMRIKHAHHFDIKYEKYTCAIHFNDCNDTFAFKKRGRDT